MAPRLMASLPFSRLEQRAQIEYDRRNGERPALLELHWDTIQRCPVLIEDGYVISMNASDRCTLRDALVWNHIHVDQMDGMVFGESFDGVLLDTEVEHLPLCQLTIRAPPLFHTYGNEYLYTPDTDMDEILEEIEVARHECA